MSKLTKTIEENKKWNKHFEENPEDNILTKLEPVNKTISYLLSLLEEKDKAIKGQHRYFERISVTFGEFECQRLAKEAMEKFTSSNNEGDN